MEIPKAMAEGVVRNSRHESKFTRPLFVSRQVQRCIPALGLGLVVSLLFGGTTFGQNLQWAKRAGGAGVDGAVIAVDSSGNSYLTGSFALGVVNGTATFGPGEANQTVLTSAGSSDIFVSKYDANGILQWAKRAGGTGGDAGASIAVDSAGNSYVTGRFTFIATFGTGEVNETILTYAGNDDIFIAKYDSNGTLQWAKRAGGVEDDGGLGIAVDTSGNGYVTGVFNGTATFGPGEANQTVLNSAGSSQDIFVAKYDSSGALQWAKRAGGGGV